MNAGEARNDYDAFLICQIKLLRVVVPLPLEVRQTK